MPTLSILNLVLTRRIYSTVGWFACNLLKKYQPWNFSRQICHPSYLLASEWFINNELKQMGLRHSGQGRKKYFYSCTYAEPWNPPFKNHFTVVAQCPGVSADCVMTRLYKTKPCTTACKFVLVYFVFVQEIVAVVCTQLIWNILWTVSDYLDLLKHLSWKENRKYSKSWRCHEWRVLAFWHSKVSLNTWSSNSNIICLSKPVSNMKLRIFCEQTRVHHKPTALRCDLKASELIPTFINSRAGDLCNST